MAAEVFRVVSGADFCRRSPATPIQVRREGCRLRCQFYVSDIDSRPELPTSTSSAEFSRSRQRAHRDAQRGVCVWPSGEEKWYRGRQRSRPAWCVCGVRGVWCGVLTGPGALGLVVGLGAGVALLHLQHKARISGLRSRSASLFSRRPFSGGCDLRVAEPARGDTHLLGNVVFIQRMRPQLVSQELEHY